MALEPDCRLAFGLGGIFFTGSPSEVVGWICYTPQPCSALAGHASKNGEMDEWFKSHAWKACVGS